MDHVPNYSSRVVVIAREAIKIRNNRPLWFWIALLALPPRK